ncbi:MAG: hypothetical protein FOGNACKC_01897 [Anaerolineae bacterium]|nr:hypothetical protein [Anaerolineae bacterium]
MVKHVLLGMIVFSLLGLTACGSSNNAEQSASSQVSLGAEAGPTTAQPAQQGAGDALESPKTGAAGETMPADQPEPAQPETAPFPGVGGLEQLTAFRVTIVLEINGAQGQSTGDQLTNQRQEYTLEVNRNPRQRHQTTSIKSEGGIQTDSSSELFFVDDVTYTRISVPGSGDSWIAQRGLLGLNQFTNPEIFAALPQTATCDSTPVQVNGVSAIHCSFSAENMPPNILTADSVSGEAWLAEDGGYLVKYLLETSGVHIKGQFEGFSRFESYKISIELTDINGDISVSLPPEAQSATMVDLPPGDGSGLAVPDGAEIVLDTPSSLVYFSAADINTIAEFHRGDLPAAGWQELPEESYVDNSNTLLVFSNETGLLRIFAHKDIDGGYFVSMTLPFESPAMGGGGDTPASGGDTGSVFPLPDNAEEVISMPGATTYFIASPVATVLEFYRAQLPPLGWAENESTAFSDDKTGLLTFEKENQTLMITINTEDDGRTSVGLYQSGQ